MCTVIELRQYKSQDLAMERYLFMILTLLIHVKYMVNIYFNTFMKNLNSLHNLVYRIVDYKAISREIPVREKYSEIYRYNLLYHLV